MRTYFVLIIMTLALHGCASFKRPSHLQKQITIVHISQSVYLDVSKAWPLTSQGKYLQKVSTTVKGKTHSFSVHITIENEKLEAIAFDDVLGRLYHLSWTPNELSWESSKNLPNQLKPEHIIADFLLTYLPKSYLTQLIEGAEIFESGDIRLVKNNQTVLRKIIRQQNIGGMWQKVIIDNPQIMYSLDIESVRLS